MANISTVRAYQKSFMKQNKANKFSSFWRAVSVHIAKQHAKYQY